jgi:hypothetical protein
MKILTSATLFSVAFTSTIAAVGAESAAAVKRARRMDAMPVIEFRHGIVPGRADGGPPSGSIDPNTTRLSEAVKAPDGVLEAQGASARMGEITPVMSVSLPNLRVGDLVPVYGRMYRVDRIEQADDPAGPKGPQQGRTGRGDWMTMALAAKDSLPPGLTFQDGSLAIPLDHDGVGRAGFGLPKTNAHVLAKSAPAKADDARGPVAEITVEIRPNQSADSESRFTGKPLPKMRTATVKVQRGDVLAVGEYGYKVRNVVPRDPEKHVIGWVELDPETVPLPKSVKAGERQ